MDKVKIARRIILGYLNNCNLTFEDWIVEITRVNDSDEVLLEHINNVLEVMNEAKKEIEKLKVKSE